MRILLIRTDSIGDVVLTLPMVSLIKHHIKGAEVWFMGKTYTRDIINCHTGVDGFLNWDELSGLSAADAAFKLSEKNFDVAVHVFPIKEIARVVKRASIPTRISTAGRWYMWPYCNELIKFTRKKSDLHESQLNFKLLKPLGFNSVPSISDLSASYADMKVPEAPDEVKSLIDPSRRSIILHPKSKGSAVEWGLENFNRLIRILPPDKYKVFITGTKEDAVLIGDQIETDPQNVVSLLGKLSLASFISFIGRCDGLVAASTGPLHIASALGIRAVGLYSPRRPIHPGRWKPIGPKALALVNDENCPKCARGENCHCIQLISPERVLEALES